jgi:hypothetical protein
MLSFPGNNGVECPICISVPCINCHGGACWPR